MANVDYSITMHNKPQEDTTPITAESPQSTASESPNLTVKSGVMLAYGATAARTTFRTIIDRTRANGNESKANIMSTAGQLAGKVAAAYATGGLSLIAEGILASQEIYTNYQERERDNIITNIENELRGKRIKIGGGNYD